jgi:hypothetical protein
MGIDSAKIALVKSCLEDAGFKDTKTKKFQEVFVFNNGKNGYELHFHRSYIDDLSEPKLKTEIASRIIPQLKENPGKRISVGEGGLHVMDRNSS